MKRTAKWLLPVAEGFAVLRAARSHRRKAHARSVYGECLMCPGDLWGRP